MRNWDWIGIGVVAAIMACIGLLVGGSFAIKNHGVHVSCLRLHENTGLQTKVARSGATTECYVRTPDGNWVPAERYRGTDD